VVAIVSRKYAQTSLSLPFGPLFPFSEDVGYDSGSSPSIMEISLRINSLICYANNETVG
jgi:hypothetical protein